MIQVDYPFYKEVYAGKIIPDEDSLKQPLLKANTYLNAVMYAEPDNTELETVKLCLCEVSDLLYLDAAVRAEHGGKDIQSENTDGYAVSYASGEENSLDVSVYGVIRRYLSGTGLLYAGVKCCDYQCCDYNF